MPRLSSLLISFLILQGCIYVPPVWDIFDAIGFVQFIEEGVTTKPRVLALFGEPDRVDEENNVLHYSGRQSLGGICFGAYGSGDCGLIKERSWWVTIEFDENDVVATVKSSPRDVGALAPREANP